MTSSLSFDGQRSYGHVKRISVDIGSRTAGSDGEARAANYIRSYFQGLGLDVREQTFGVQSVALVSHKAEVIEPALGEIPSWPILATPDTPQQGLTGDLVFVEGCEEPYVGPHIEGKIVLWAVSGRTEFWTRYRALTKHHPLAIIVIWPALGVKPKRLQMGDVADSPGDMISSFCITYEDGLRLLRTGARKVRLRMQSERKQATSRNIIGELRGNECAEEIVVVGAHYDSVAGVPGAVDNASGLAAVMELARLYTQRGSKRTLRFIGWGAEESGMLGSWHYVGELVEQDKGRQAPLAITDVGAEGGLGRHLLCISLDALGITLGQNVCYAAAPIDILETIRAIAREIGMPHEIKEDFYGSDSEVFAQAGIPAISFAREGIAFSFLHTSDDAIDLIDAGQLQQIGSLVDTFLMRTAAGAIVWPFERRLPDKSAKQVADTLEKFGWVRKRY